MGNNTIQTFGNIVFILVIVYSFFRIGEKLAKNDFKNTSTFWIWILVILMFIGGFGMTNKNNFLGIFGFIPILTYIFIKIFDRMDMSYSTTKKVKNGFRSIIGSIVTYIITATVFGYGVTEASISAIIVAMVLGLYGFSG